ncbi:MAG: bacterial transcriptional activator domain-containing protein [Elusimicrobiota bacterium]
MKRPIPLLVAVAFVIRLVYILQVRSEPLFLYPVVDALSYDRWARSILQGHLLGSGVFYQDPLYPYLLAGFYGVFGASRLALALAQAGLDALGAGLLAWTGSRLFSPAVGLLAGAGLALYAPAVFYVGVFEKTTLVLFLTSLLLFLLARGRPFPAGLSLGACLLCRGNFFLFAPAAAAWQRSWKAAAVFAGGCILVIAPVTLRNLVVGKDFVLTTSQAGWNFYKGNCPEATGGLIEPLGVRNVPEYEETENRALAGGGRPSEVSRRWFRQGLSFIASHPAAWLRLTWCKLILLVNAFELSDVYDFYYFKERSSLLRALPLGFGLLFPLAVGGVALAAVRKQAMMPLLLAACYGASLVAFYVTGRYRIALVPPLLLYAAYGLCALPGQRPGGRGLWAACVLPLLLLVRVPVAAPNLDRSRFVAATELLRHGRPQEAASALRSMLPRNASCPRLHYNLAMALLRSGREPEGLQAFEDCMRHASGELREHALENISALKTRGVRGTGKTAASDGYCPLEMRAYTARIGP